jgi:hypothetical protein
VRTVSRAAASGSIWLNCSPPRAKILEPQTADESPSRADGMRFSQEGHSCPTLQGCRHSSRTGGKRPSLGTASTTAMALAAARSARSIGIGIGGRTNSFYSRRAEHCPTAVSLPLRSGGTLGLSTYCRSTVP